jgi:hypothetical protein
MLGFSRGAVVVALAVLAAGTASEASASNLSCHLAIKSACGRVAPSGESVRACFHSHHARLSRSCGARLPRFVAVTRQCEEDALRFCGHVARASGLHNCMNRRLHEVSPPCRAALAKVGVRAR